MMRSIDAVRVGVDEFVCDHGQFYRGGDNTATTMSFDAGQDDDKYLDSGNAERWALTHATKVWGMWGGVKKIVARANI